VLDDFSREELKQKSMLELASIVLQDAKKALNFQEIFNQIAELKGFSKEEKELKIAQFYTELNVDGRFLTLGSNLWGLKAWYPVDQAEEEIAPAPKKRKSKKKDELEEEEDLEYEEDLVELGEEEEKDLEDIDEAFDEEDQVYDEDLEEEEVIDDPDLDLEEDDEEKI
jgi:DNA-directed RNA polymerase subunit delta